MMAAKRLELPANQRTKLCSCAEKCELCGNKRNLEVHHIIPVSCGGNNQIDNLMVLCNTCHAKLTPRGLLARLGMANLARRNELNEEIIRFYESLDPDCWEVDLVFDKIETFTDRLRAMVASWHGKEIR